MVIGICVMFDSKVCLKLQKKKKNQVPSMDEADRWRGPQSALQSVPRSTQLYTWPDVLLTVNP